MQTKDIKHTLILDCTPQVAYDAWLDSKTHGEIIEADAVIVPMVGGAYSLWDDNTTGRTLELHPNKCVIVQSWRDNSMGWPDNYFTTITLQFVKEHDNQTKLYFVQKGIPEKDAKSIEDGWQEYYWAPMKRYFRKINS
jgi:activator of HSP90 ATPase